MDGGGEGESKAARTRAFYRDHADEVIERMRNPSTPTNNIAAEIVLECESNSRLRAEAERVIEVARTAREARSALDLALASYGRTNLRLERKRGGPSSDDTGPAGFGRQGSTDVARGCRFRRCHSSSGCRTTAALDSGGTMSNPVWPMLAAERSALAGYLATLSDADWRCASPCTGWTVRDLVAHVVAGAETTPLNFGPSMIVSGFSFDRLAYVLASDSMPTRRRPS